MTPKQRAITALKLGQPEGLVPTFELEFQLTQELLGREFYVGSVWQKATAKEREQMFHANAELFVDIAKRLDYNIIMDTRSPGIEGILENAKLMRQMVGDEYMIIVHGDATYGIPNGENMTQFVADLYEKPDEMKRRADEMVDRTIERGKKLLDGGIDGFALCSDYCLNTGPFLPPKMFAEFVTPFLARLIGAYRDMGAYAIKHTDGNIMPILDQLVSCNPHAIHSLDCQAQDMDIKVIKQLVGDKVCLIGGVQCSLLQTGTEEEIVKNCKYVLKYGMPGGGYIYSTTNVAFKGLPLERYLLILEMRQKYGRYS